MANNANKQTAEEVLAAVGGKDNVESVQHCMTRLRFKLKDDSIPNDEEIKKIGGVLGCVRASGQVQVVIGQNVPKVYDEVIKLGGFAMQDSIKENLDAPKEKLTWKQIGSNIMNYLTGSFTPLIPAMIAAALFKSITAIFGPTMLGLMSAESDIYVMCDFMYSACFYFLPILLGYSASKRIGTNPVLGIMLGASLVVPGFVSLIEVQESIKIWGLFPAPVASYSQTVLPILIAIPVLNVIEKFIYKHTPDVLVTTIAPFITLCVMIPITFCFAAPVGSWLGNGLGTVLFWFANHGGFLAVGVISAVFQLMVMTGMHHVIGTLAITVMLEQGVEFCVRPANAIAAFAVYGMALGAFLRMKDKKEKSLAFGYTVSCLVAGVTEPTLFGIGIRYRRPFIGMVIGGFVGGIFAGIMHVGCYQFASPGVLHILAFVNGGAANLANGTISCVLALIVSAAVTFVLGGFEENEKSFILKKKNR